MAGLKRTGEFNARLRATKIFKNQGLISKTIIDNSKGIFCLGWKNALGALATQSKMI